ncbi:MAG: hypothetical protein ACK4VY_09870 [Brevundimonas sp.]
MDVVQPRPQDGPSPTPPPTEDAPALRRALRDLIWRVDEVAEQLRSAARTMDDQTLVKVLDTADAKRLLTGGADAVR